MRLQEWLHRRALTNLVRYIECILPKRSMDTRWQMFSTFIGSCQCSCLTSFFARDNSVEPTKSTSIDAQRLIPQQKELHRGVMGRIEQDRSLA
jgi:hypothetical protein